MVVFCVLTLFFVTFILVQSEVFDINGDCVEDITKYCVNQQDQSDLQCLIQHLFLEETGQSKDGRVSNQCNIAITMHKIHEKQMQSSAEHTQLVSVCRQESIQFCSYYTDDVRLLKCLSENVKNLSEECQSNVLQSSAAQM